MLTIKQQAAIWIPILSAALLLSACSGTTAPTPLATAVAGTGITATRPPATQAAPTTSAPKPTATVMAPSTNSLSIDNQTLGAGDVVTVADVHTDGPGWVVIQADDQGKPGKVLGYTAVKAGNNPDVAVMIDPKGATAKLHAALELDAGKVGTFEYPGADKPAMDKAGKEISASFTLTMLPNHNAVTVKDQELAFDGTVTIDSVTADGPGWLVVHTDDKGQPGAVIGHVQLTPGENHQVKVTIETGKLTPRLFAMLHVDVGKLGTFEFPGTDIPARGQDGSMVAPSFAVTIPNAVSVTDQALGTDNMIKVAAVLTPNPAFIAIQADNNGEPGAVIGYTAVKAGLNLDVKVKIDPSQKTDKLYAVLHVDEGAAGAFDFPGVDIPAVDAQGHMVIPSFNLTK
jgi:hypothetical protein